MGVSSIAKFIWQNPGNKGKRLRKLVRACEWQLYKRTVGKPRILTLPNGMRFKAYPDCVISSALQYADWPEYTELQYCRSQLRPGDTIIDVGANVGHFSLLLADIVEPSNLICFEPTPVSWGRLVENFSLNGWSVDKLYQLAVGRANGTVQFPDTKTPTTNNSAVVVSGGEKIALVNVTSLNELAKTLRQDSVGLLKVDVEGYELEVFRGAEDFFKDIRPRLVMFESLGGELAPEVRSLLTNSGYHIFQLDKLFRPEVGQLTAQNLFARPLS